MDPVKSRWTQTLLLLIAVPLWVLTLRPLLAPTAAIAQTPSIAAPKAAAAGTSSSATDGGAGRYQLVVTPSIAVPQGAMGGREYVIDTVTGHVWHYKLNRETGSGTWVDMGVPAP